MPRIFEQAQFYWLSFALIGLILTGSLARELPDSLALRLVEFSSVVLLLISLLSLATDRKWSRWLLGLLGAMLAAAVARELTGHAFFEYSHLALLLAFMLLASWLVGRHVLLSGSVDLNKIVGSISLYLMLGLVYSILYTTLLQFSPNAIEGIEPGPWYDVMPATTYFSFVTLTTLGYGDMSPASPTAEVLAVLEAVTGMFYLAIIVASLVGAMRSDRPRRN